MKVEKVGNRYEMRRLDEKDCISGDFGEDISLAVCREARVLGLYADCAQRSFVERVKQILDSLTSLKELLSLKDLFSNGDDCSLDKKLDETCQVAINLLQKYQENDLILDKNNHYKRSLESHITEEKKHHNEMEHVDSIISSHAYQKYLDMKDKLITRDDNLLLDLSDKQIIDLLKSWKPVTLPEVKSITFENINYQNLKSMKHFILNCFPQKLDKLDIRTQRLPFKDCKRFMKEIMSISHKIQTESCFYNLQISKKQFMRLISANQNKRTVVFSKCKILLKGIPDFTYALNESTLKVLRLNKCRILYLTASSNNRDGLAILVNRLSKSASFLKNLMFLHLSGYGLAKIPSLQNKLSQCGLAKRQIYYSK
ncbi:unnamed protein product [Moneuplotes crassus]|uniref:Uncharacterized protein n=1 Tax=Euplotes crassus TaxID=5936 RepID=A0AAD1UP87_EUPCR|nr:unnamed protein product [Moneuplotes crassus]